MAVTEEKAQQEPSMEEILASIRRIISADGEDEAEAETANGAEAAGVAEPTPPAEQVGAGGEAETDDVLELTDQVGAAPEPEPEREPGPEPEPEPEPQADDDRPAPPPEAGPLVSPATAAASVTSLDGLAQALAGPGARDDSGGRTVEDLAADLLRPMLREWLDHNLPGMVETLVRAEIERLAGQIKR